MSSLRVVLFGLIICTTAVYAAEPSSTFQSRAEKSHFLFSSYRTTQKIQPDMREMVGETIPAKKSVGLAAIYSLLLPGMGELYAGNFTSGKYFLIGEGALWLTYATFDVYGNALRDDARAFAISRAGIAASGKDDQFFVDIGNFSDVYQFNEKRLRDREPDRLYDPNAGFGWRWDSETSRVEYKEQRLSAERVLNNRKFIIAAVVVNHIASAINAARAVISHNKNVGEQTGEVRFGARVMGGLANPHGVMITVVHGL